MQQNFPRSNGLSGSNESKAASLSPPPAPEALRRLVYWLEECFRIPGTTLRFGFDSVLGVVPGAGDFVGLISGVPILVTAVRRRLPWRVLLVMFVNALLDMVVGSLPLVGDIFDLMWKSHKKNYELLEAPQRLSEVLREARAKLSLLVLALVILAAASIWILWLMATLYVRLVIGALG